MEESQAEAQAHARASGRRGSFGARPRPLDALARSRRRARGCHSFGRTA